MVTGKRIIIIEDEADLVELIRYNFSREGFEVQGFLSGKRGYDAVRREPPDVLLLDVMLPDEDGFSLCRKLRADSRLKSLPIVFLTARGEELDRVLGFELGADDYVVKPFSPRELVARVKAILRRGPHESAAEAEQAIEVRGLRLDPRTQEVTIDGRPVEVTTLEFKLLYFLASHQRQIFSRERLLDEVWGAACSITPRTVDVHIRRLREKIEPEPEAPRYIGTVRGAGYRLMGQAEN